VRERIDAVPFLFGENMNAKMVITVPIDKIPKEVTRILDDINIELSEIMHETSELINSEDQLNKIQKIDEIRKRLSLIDLNYEDCYSVLLGYTKYQTEKRMNELAPQEQENKDGNQSNG
jgi:hypothetical protein